MLMLSLTRVDAFAPSAWPMARSYCRGPRAHVSCGEGKGAIGGAVLGGLIAGPFGALWGAQIGGAVGANNRAKREARERLDRMGISKDILQAAEQVAVNLQDAEERCGCPKYSLHVHGIHSPRISTLAGSLSIVRSAEESQQALLTTLEASSQGAYAAAEEALRNGDEAAARARLEERQQLNQKISAATIELASASERVLTMQASVVRLSEQASNIEALVSRAVTSSTTAGGTSSATLELEDPLLRRIEELEGK